MTPENTYPLVLVELLNNLISCDVRTGILLDILHERGEQDDIWGGPKEDDKHTGYDWIALVTKQLARAVDGAFEADAEEYCIAMARVAALAIAAIESTKRKASM